MDHEFGYLDIVILGVIAIFLIYRLGGILGQRHGEERRRPNFFSTAPKVPENTTSTTRPNPFLVSLPEEDLPHTLARGLSRLEKADPTFREKDFLRGAKEAFRLIVTAFASGDLSSVASLLSPQILDHFKAVIEQRQQAGEIQQTNILSVRNAVFHDVRLEGQLARAVVEFNSQQIIVRRDRNGLILEGHPTKPKEVVDIWTFQRNITSPDPNWQLISTESRS